MCMVRVWCKCKHSPRMDSLHLKLHVAREEPAMHGNIHDKMDIYTKSAFTRHLPEPVIQIILRLMIPIASVGFNVSLFYGSNSTTYMYGH